ARVYSPLVAKDTEKLIRQLSLISFLMANGRPVSALEIKREVEGYSSMNDDAFARRFYADRAELESLGISLQVQKPAEGFFEAELYALPPENYYLPEIEFTDEELAALRTALGLLDGEFAYAEPLRLALQQVSWGRPSPLTDEDSAPIDVKLAPASGGRELSQRLAKIETAISRRKTVEFSYYSMERDFGGHGKLRRATRKDGVSGRGSIYETEYASRRQLISWVLGWRENATLLEPKDLAAEAAERLGLLRERHGEEFEVAETVSRPIAEGNGRPRSNGRSESVIRPERFARLVTLAGFLIEAAREGVRLPVKRVLDELKISM